MTSQLCKSTRIINCINFKINASYINGMLYGYHCTERVIFSTVKVDNREI